MICPPFSLSVSCSRMVIPPRMVIHAYGGFGSDLTSTRWSFLSLLTSISVSSKVLLAVSTDFSASSFNACASFACLVAIASSYDTMIYFSSASLCSISIVRIISSVYFAAISSFGCMSVSWIYISATCLLASISRSKPFFKRVTAVRNSTRLLRKIVLNIFNNSK